MRLNAPMVVAMFVFIASCGGDDTGAQLAEQERRIAELEAALAAVTSTSAGTSTTQLSTTQPPTTTSPRLRTVNGTFTLFEEGTLTADGGLRWPGRNVLQEGQSMCLAGGGYSDVDVGNEVVVRDEQGVILGSAELDSLMGNSVFGLLDVLIDGGDGWATCTWEFHAAGIPDDRAFYAITVGQRGEVVFSREELEANYWKVKFELGR